MTVSPQAPPDRAPSDRHLLPAPLRNRAMFCAILGALCGLFSVNEAASLSHLSELREQARSGNAFIDPQLAERMAGAQVAALEKMRVPRAIILSALAVACALTFIAASRMVPARVDSITI